MQILTDQSFKTPSALVLCGGGSHGALEVGFAMALEEAGLLPGRILGTSIGAFNGAFIAGGMPLEDLKTLWLELKFWKIARPNWSWGWRPKTRPGFIALNALRKLLQSRLPATRFEDLKIPLTVVTTDLSSGKACYWEDEGDMIEPLIASMSLPGICPPVPLKGHLHIDGGIADNAPIGRAKLHGAKTVFMIECDCANPCETPPKGWSGVMGRAFEIALSRKHTIELEVQRSNIDIFRVVPDLHAQPGLLDLSQSAALFEAAYLQTRKALSGEPVFEHQKHGGIRRIEAPDLTARNA